MSLPDAVRPLSSVVEDEDAVEVEDTGYGIMAVHCPECDVLVAVERVAVEPVPGEEYVRHVGYVVSCDHDFTPDEAADAAGVES